MDYVFVAAGLVLLLLGGEMLVRGAVGLAGHLGVSPLLIGLTIVAYGTTAPELLVSVEAHLSGHSSMAVGNVVGSNIANILLVLGLSALIYPLVCETRSVGRDCLVMLATSFGFIGLCWWGEIGRVQGLVMVGGLACYLAWSYIDGRNSDHPASISVVDELDGVAARPTSPWTAIAFVLAGIVGLVFGARLLVDGATQIARDFGITEAVIGLTLVAVGTSLPELATSLVAALRRHGEVAIGNVIGSNLFNILAVMGFTAVVKPIPVAPQFLNFDLWVMLAATAVLTAYALKCKPIGRRAGGLLFVLYLAYIWALFSGYVGLAHQTA